MSISSILRGIFPFLVNPMAPGNMKSDFVGLQRNKIVSKSALSRKALARIGQNDEVSSPVNMAMLTGEANPRQPSLTSASAGDAGACTKNSAGHPAVAEQGDHEPSLDEGRALDKHEVQHLKALSMLHLDVIEQQQQEIQRREHELQKVRAQNDTLKARLERIQRRTVLAQKHQETLPNHVHIPAPVSSSDSSCTSKRKSNTELTTPVKRQQTDSPTPSPACTPTGARRNNKQLGRLETKERGRGRDRDRDRSQRTKDDRSERSRTNEDRTLRREERTPRKLEAQGSRGKEEKRNGGEQERGGVKGEQYLKTQVIYPCLSDLRSMDPDPALPEGQTVVQIPSWRVNVLNSSTGTEAVEDIEEATFERRHQKYEVAEQKRKRWDIQRVRELREHERLEQKMLRREYGNWDDILKTFHPEPSDACQLQVSDTIPLVAFGVQVPVAKDDEFELPWFDVNEREKEESRRQTRSRTNRR